MKFRMPEGARREDMPTIPAPQEEMDAKAKADLAKAKIEQINEVFETFDAQQAALDKLAEYKKGINLDSGITSLQELVDQEEAAAESYRISQRLEQRESAEAADQQSIEQIKE